MMEQFRRSRWIAVAIMMLLVGLTAQRLLFRTFSISLILETLLRLWALGAAVVWLIRVLISGGKRLAASAVLMVYLAGFALSVFAPWESIRHRFIWPYQEPKFERLKETLLAQHKMRLFCWWSEDRYRINDVFYGEYSFAGVTRVGMYSSADGHKPLERAAVLESAGLTEAELRALGAKMERMGVSCAELGLGGAIKFITWGFLDTECGYVVQHPLSATPNMEGRLATPLGRGWFEYCS